MVVGRKGYLRAFHQLEEIRVGIQVSDRLNDLKSGPAILPVVDPLLRTGALLAASVACILCKLGATLLGRTEGPDGLPGVETHPDLAFSDHAVEARLVSVALPLVAVQVVPARELVVAEPTREPGARLLAHEPLTPKPQNPFIYL